MNIFNIPSWYPSYENPIYGTFTKEQIEMLARENPHWNFGVSTWGQGRPSHMLPMKDHLLNLGKLVRSSMYESHTDQQNNVSHFYTPAVTWTRKILHGNLSGVSKANNRNFLKFKNYVKNIDIIHAQATYPAALVARTLSKKYGIPYVVSIRMSPFPFNEFLTSGGQLRSLISEPLQNANALIATSSSLKNRMESLGLSNVQVINNPVDTDFFDYLGHESDELNILSIARLEDQKGIDILIESIALLGNQFQGKLRVGGEGSRKFAYQNLALEKGIDHKIEWLGELSREQVRDEMQRCSFYALPSRHETFGNVLLEAMACGKPLIATRCGGPEDIVTNEVGFLCEVENVQDLAKNISQMIEVYRTFQPENLRKEVLAKFPSESFSDQMKKIYSSTIAS